MCGIVGYVGKGNAIPILLDGLKHLEYRGYDSAGLAFLHKDRLLVQKAAGKLSNLVHLMDGNAPAANYGIGHTRWATHGKPSNDNAHPHIDCSGTIALVHNGIIENYQALKAELIAEGHYFRSETDTEVAVHLIEKYFDGNLKRAIAQAITRLEGSFAISVISTHEPGRIFGARRFSPLIVGVGRNEYYLASDIPAFLSHTRNEITIGDEELVELSEQGVEITDLRSNALVERQSERIDWSAEQAEKGGYAHYMLKEIHEQPAAIRATVLDRITDQDVDLNSIISHIDLTRIDQCQIVACGTSYHAGLTAKYIIETLCGIPVAVELASEYRYKRVISSPHTLVIAISQSGETADTIGALKYAREHGWPILGICNVIGSSIPRLSDDCIFTKAGPEIGVASTKAFTTQLTVFYLLALHWAKLRNQITTIEMAEMIDALKRLPGLAERVLLCAPQIQEIAQQYQQQHTFLYLGRWISYPAALEGALKLKEISYINAQGYAAGEMKHGPIALIEPGVPVVVLAAHNQVYEKMLSNIEEVQARGGSVIALLDEANTELAAQVQHAIYLPGTHPFLTPILQAIPLQLLAYYLGIARGCDVDQPRNLAKSVTVE